jgi:single-stranded-DNA-specific exonuclease
MRRNAALAEPLGLHYSDIVDRVLRNRGISAEHELSVQAKHLQHYKALNGINKASELLADAIEAQKSIYIIGDFDADGATSTALCMLALRKMGCISVNYIVPNRFDYGYGLTSPVVDLAHEAGADVLITVDNGISSIEGVRHAKSLGLTVIVTDHHLPGKELPIADAIVNPNQTLCDFPSKNLAGVGVAFYVMSATKNVLEKKAYFEKRQIPPPNMADYLDIVAVGTVADVVPLDKNNRILVHQGIQRIRSGKTRPGILALLHITNRQYARCCTTDIGFVIGPRLNAAGRLDDMSLGIECLLC